MRFEFPLRWLPQQPRTLNPQRANFANHSSYKAGNYLFDELRLLKAENIIISSNLLINRDNSISARQSRGVDAGVVIYFKLKGENRAMACDKWDFVEHNLWALHKSIDAIRGLKRWGGSAMEEAVFTGFKALPSPGEIIIPSVQYFLGLTEADDIKKRFKELAKEFHPDVEGGNAEKFQELNKQYQERTK